MKCMVLGGAGFLGEHLCKALLRDGHEVSVYDRKSERLNELKNKYKMIDFIEGNFIEESSFFEVIEFSDVVFHLISTTVPSNTDTVWDVSSNVIPTLRLLEACKEKKVKIVYFSSGGTVYGKPKVVPIVESHETNPISSHGVQKLTIEKYLQLYGEFYGLEYIILRISNPYGEGQIPFRSQGVVATFLARALSQEPLEVWGDTAIVRDYIYVEDVVNAVALILNYHGGEKIFNISSHVGVSLQEIVDLIEKNVIGKIEIKYVQGRKQDVPVNVLDNNKAVKELQWNPNVPLDEGIKKMIASWDKKSQMFLIK